MKKYFKGLGIALVYAPFAISKLIFGCARKNSSELGSKLTCTKITGIIIMATGMVCKAAGYALFGDFQHATDEIKQVKLL